MDSQPELQPAQPGAPTTRRWRLTPDRVAGLLIVLFAAWYLWQATQLRGGPGYAAVGPRVFPIIIGLGFLASGLGLLAAREPAPGAGAEPEAPEATESHDHRTLGVVALLLAGYVLLFRPLGHVLATTAFLFTTSRALGSRSPARDLAVGVLLALSTYTLFTRLLGLELPAGPLEEPLRLLSHGP